MFMAVAPKFGDGLERVHVWPARRVGRPAKGFSGFRTALWTNKRIPEQTRKTYWISKTSRSPTCSLPSPEKATRGTTPPDFGLSAVILVLAG